MHKRLQTLVAIGCALFALSAGAQDPLLQPLPIDPAVRMGRLDNGLTYIIRHNEKPAQRAHFLIAQRVGSMQEEDSQSGLAHFLEHMAFNGTKNFPGKSLINYLEGNGIKFGENLNAFTAFDETVYMIMNAPSARKSMVDSCLLILHDWSTAISLDGDEIDKERGVIHEEWRSRDNGGLRAMTEVMRRGFPGDQRYGKRMPIGSMDVVLNFDHQTLRDYYHRWYRPDLQGIIVVGDIDVDAVEAKIKELFGPIRLDPNRPERVYPEVPDQAEPISIVATDPEIVGTSVTALYSSKAWPIMERNTPMYMVNNYVMTMLSAMMNQRFAEEAMKPGCPYLSTTLSYEPYFVALTRDALALQVNADKGKYKPAMDAALLTLKQAALYGFSDSEYRLVRTNYLSMLENSLKSKESRENGDYADEYATFFTQGGYIPGIEVEYEWANKMAQQISVESINQALKSLVLNCGNNLTLYLMAPKADDLTYPTDRQLLQEYDTAMQQKVEPYKEQAIAQDLLAEHPTGGTITQVEENQPYGSTLLHLSNGVKVYLQPQTHEKNQVSLVGVSPGGTSLYDEAKESIDLRALPSYATVGGLGAHDPIQLSRILAGKAASISTTVTTTERVSGSSSTADVETMLQLAYLAMTDVRADTTLFRNVQDRMIAKIRAGKANPMATVMQDSISSLIYGDNQVMAKYLTEEETKAINYSRILEIYRERFANADDFTFFISGDFDPETVKPLVAQYLGALPSTKRVETPDLTKVLSHAPKGRVSHFDFKMDTPTASVIDLYAGQGAYNLRERLIMGLLTDVLNQAFHVSIREDEGGTYGVGVMGDVDRLPLGQRSLMIMYKTSPKEAERLNDIIKKQLREMAQNGIDEDYFKKAVLNREKSHTEALETNGYWAGLLYDKVIWGEETHDTYLRTLHSITAEEIRDYLAQILSKDQYFEMIASGKPDAA